MSLDTADVVRDVSTTQDEVRARAWTQEELADGSKRRQLNRLRPQLARRQLVTQTHPFGFDSRRLHHSIRSRCSLARGVDAVARHSAIGASRLGLRARLPPPPIPINCFQAVAYGRAHYAHVPVASQKEGRRKSAAVTNNQIMHVILSPSQVSESSVDAPDWNKPRGVRNHRHHPRMDRGGAEGAC